MSEMNPKQIYSVVVVDDSEDDRYFLRSVIAKYTRFSLLRELCDGTEVVEYLRGGGKFGDRGKYPLPDLLLLDLKMPRMTGMEVLKWLKSQVFPSLTVVVLSSSPLQQDVEGSMALGAHGYWSKTATPEKQRLIAVEIEALLDRRFSQLDITKQRNCQQKAAANQKDDFYAESERM